MKKLIFILVFIFASILTKAATYYVGTGGNFTTLAQVNAATFAAGDQILFKRGEVFYGTLNVNYSGSSGSPIVYGAYGTGSNPIITGFTDVTAWTNLGSNIFESTNAVSTLSTCLMVTVNGTMYAMGKQPNSGYYTYQSHTSSSITSSDLSGTPNWTGAEVALQLYPWTVGRCVITSQSGGTVTFTKTGSDVSPNQDNQKFVIQNDPRTLDVQNEWYFDPTSKKIRIYSTAQPFGVRISSVTNNVVLNTKSYVTFQNITFEGANGDAISLTKAGNVSITDCTVRFAGKDAIWGAYGDFSDNVLIDNCTVENVNNDGITLSDDFRNAIIRSCTVTNIGTNIGMTVVGSTNGNTGGQFIGITAVGAGTLIELSSVTNTGYNGIVLKNDNSIVQRNFVSDACTIITDGGGIYTWNGIPSGVTHSGMKILNNIVTNVITDNGIYLDDATNGIEVKNNTVYNCKTGIYLHNSYNGPVRNNTVFGCSISLYIYNSDETITMSNHPVTANKFVARLASDKVFYSYAAERIKDVYRGDSNYWCRPIAETTPFRYQIASPFSQHDVNLAGFVSYFTGQELHSIISPVTISTTNDFFFAYNATNASVPVNLPYPCVDLSGNKVTGFINLTAYGGKVLLKDPSPAAPVPAGSKFIMKGNTLIPIINPNNNKWIVR